MPASDAQKVRIELTHAEALVLFEWLARTDGQLPFVDDAEQVPLWRIEGQLEPLLPELFKPDYVALVAAARDEVRALPASR